MDVVVIIFVICSIYYSFGKKESNTCKTFADYNTVDTNPNCWYNPDVTATVPEMIKRHGYPLEEYETVTKDKYILKVYRIPRKENECKGVFFLQHPAFLTSAVYTDLGNQSLAFYLWDEGYDVWMGNFRGTIYSPNHEKLSQKTQTNQYWNFSFHEFGIYDLPAFIDLCREKTHFKYKIYFIGHSVATSAALIYASLLVEHAEDNVQLLTLWSPMAFMGHGYSLAGVLAPFANLIMAVAELVHVTYTPEYNGLIHRSIEDFCEHGSMQFCYDIFQLMFGPDIMHVQPEWFPLAIYQSFAGFPLKAIVHNYQIIDAKGRFQFFDYGFIKNLEYYHSGVPPSYPIKNIRTPVYIVHGGNDAMSPSQDARHLYDQLNKNVRYGIRLIPGYAHMDFQYGKDIRKVLYKPTLKAIEEMKIERKQSLKSLINRRT
ncbi:hypothetical protein ILUMI_12834 [Ignelater luminosus]|uniref:Lipase n=1 Tax=Ignelater luminosus TaxID=2038154 RepID=A0A8K0GBZ0_IGNLU|nr:hypothetical protein ILUMI_12834 [Ignelater luminosus]